MSPCYHNQLHIQCIFSFYNEDQKALLGQEDEVVSQWERKVLGRKCQNGNFVYIFSHPLVPILPIADANQTIL